LAWQYKFHPAAQEDYESSVSWYLKRSLKAATNFVDTVENGLSFICADPKICRNTYKNYHELTLPKYPCTIVFTMEESQQMVIIIAIYHQKRNPDKKYR
jgi:plasmid stabilization system protein ParE